jgi:hypothetical protein
MNLVQDREELQALLEEGDQFIDKLTAINSKELCYVVLVNITFSLCLIKHHFMKTYWGLEV